MLGHFFYRTHIQFRKLLILMSFIYIILEPTDSTLSSLYLAYFFDFSRDSCVLSREDARPLALSSDILSVNAYAESAI